MYNNIFYFWHLNEIGGIESFYWYLARKYKDWDITIFYKTGDPRQIERLSRYVRVKRYEGGIIKCKKAFFNYNLDIIDKVEAEEYIQIAHGDYKALGVPPNTHPKINRYVGVSKQVCKTYSEVTEFETELNYNPIEKPKTKKVLNLISMTRLTKEKGAGRMQKLIEALDEAKIPFLWLVFTDLNNPWLDSINIDHPSVVFMKTRLDPYDYIANADYLVQLSDNEGYCYSVVEALLVGTPVIVTPCPVFKELGVNTKNSITLPFDMKDIPVKKIYKGLEPFEYRPKRDSWKKYLEPGESTYQEELKTMVRLECIKDYEDLQLRRHVEKGEELMVNRLRADVLIEGEVAREIE